MSQAAPRLTLALASLLITATALTQPHRTEKPEHAG